MGELIIHIDQDSGAVTRVEQKLKYDEKRALERKNYYDIGEKEILSNLERRIENETEPEGQEALKRLQEKIIKTEMIIKEWLKSEKEKIIVPLLPLGDLYNDNPAVVNFLKERRDLFQRHIPLPVELWEKIGNTVCTVRVGGVIRRCIH